MSVETTEENVSPKVFFAPSMSFEKVHQTASECIDLSQSGNLAVSGSGDSLLVWNAQNGTILVSFLFLFLSIDAEGYRTNVC